MELSNKEINKITIKEEQNNYQEYMVDNLLYHLIHKILRLIKNFHH